MNGKRDCKEQALSMLRTRARVEALEKYDEARREAWRRALQPWADQLPPPPPDSEGEKEAKP